METLKQEVEKTVRRFYGFGSNIAVNNVEVQFGISTQNNGVVHITQDKPTEKRPYNKKKTPTAKASHSMHREYTTSPEDIAVMRHFFATWEREDKLSPDQKEVLNRTKGIHYPMLDENMKNEMLRLFEQIREKGLFKKNKEEVNV